MCLFPVCGKGFEGLLYNNMSSFFFFSENDLILRRKSGFRPDDSFVNQLVSIAHEIISAFDDGQGVSFSIYLKRLIEFGMKACFSSYKKTGYWES